MRPPLFIPTERESVTLKEVTQDHSRALFDAVDASREHLDRSGNTTSRGFPTLISVEEAVARYQYADDVWLGIWDQDTFVGSIDLREVGSGTAEIGYWLDRRYTGQGFATLATRALVAHFKDQFSLYRAEVAEGNDASADVLRRSGFHEISKHTGQLVFEYAYEGTGTELEVK